MAFLFLERVEVTVTLTTTVFFINLNTRFTLVSEE